MNDWNGEYTEYNIVGIYNRVLSIPIWVANFYITINFYFEERA